MRRIRSLPRGIPAASLKLAHLALWRRGLLRSSAGNTRGLIEAWGPRAWSPRPVRVFRGEYPRPH